MADAASQGHSSWLQATARQRIAGLLDPGSFVEFLGPAERLQSPHLHLFDLPAAFDDGVIIGRGTLDGTPVLLAAQEGQFMGVHFGEVSGAKIVGLLRAARDHADLPLAVLLLLDSGGVRLQEANAGEVAVAEVMRAVAEARSAGVAVIALVGGRSGAFGGAGLTAATCARIVVSEQGRIGVSGPEVIETNKGVEEFDSRDRALVWRVTGGKNRRLIGGADAFAADTMDGFRAAAKAMLAEVPAFDLRTMQAEQERLAARQATLGGCEDALGMWTNLGIEAPEAVSAMPTERFVTLVHSIEEPAVTLDEILRSLFPSGHDVVAGVDGLVTGTAIRKGGGPLAVIGVANGTALSAAGALTLADRVLQVVAAGGDTPILVLVDTKGQLMARREEMLGLNEYLAHLAKCLLLASQQGHRTIGLVYGQAAAGAFLATALATDLLIGLPGAAPAVMDLPSVARVTKLPVDRLKELSKTTSVFAPGLDAMVEMGAIAAVWDPDKPLDAQLEAALAVASPRDVRDELGAERKGRPMAAVVAGRVIAEATGGR